MKLLKHRQDLKWLEAHLPHREVDDKGCVLCQIIKRQRNLIMLADESLEYYDLTLNRKLAKYVKRVLKDAEVKK